jgi:hypothetical protein
VETQEWMIGILGKGIWGQLKCMDYIILELMIWVGKVLKALLNLNNYHHLIDNQLVFHQVSVEK